MKHYDSATYRTQDLALAAALVVCGFELSQLEQIDYRKMLFVFKPHEKLTAAVDAYWSDKLRVSPKRYFDALKHLKTRIYAGQ